MLINTEQVESMPGGGKNYTSNQADQLKVQEKFSEKPSASQNVSRELYTFYTLRIPTCRGSLYAVFHNSMEWHIKCM